ncbi:2-dehydropantoate 2-reductase [Dactylosporangium sp. NPDC051485]|uniref:ketopantoate reductase family protein n=1 Tax=Dactylosporangium sp. NPDC051485 TaxID=3154846 RepID=UPI0034169273
MSSVAIVGPGGVGGLLGGVLTRAGHDVVYVARPETAAALREGGLRVRSVQFGDFEVPARAVGMLSDPVDLAVVAPKATSLGPALDRVPPELVDVMLPLLNGVDHMVALRERYPRARVVAGSISVESTRVAPGRIEHTSPFCTVQAAGPGADLVAEVLGGAGFEVKVRDTEAGVLWDKLALLAPMALITTAAGASVGPAREALRDDLEQMVVEVAAVANASGASIDPAAILAIVAQLPPQMKSSMLRDAEAGRPLELDAIGGSVLHAGAALGIATPVTARVVAQLRRAA